MYQPNDKLPSASPQIQVGSNKCKFTNWSFPIKLQRLGYNCDILEVIRAVYQPNDKLLHASSDTQGGLNKSKYSNWSFPNKF